MLRLAPDFSYLGSLPTAPRPALPLVFAHYLPWYVGEPGRFALLTSHPGATAQPAPLLPGRHWRDPGSGYSWSHLHMPARGRYDSRDPAVLQEQFAQARQANIQGFTINWYGQNAAENSITLAFLEQLERWNRKHPEEPLLYFLCIDSQCGLPTEGKTPVPLVEDLAYVRRHLMQRGYLLRDGRPVFACFPYDDDAPRWLAALARVFGADGADLLWNGVGPGAGEAGAYAWVRPSAATLASGLYPWTDPDDSGADYLNALYAEWNAATRGHRYGMAGVWPGFNDTLVTWAWKNPAAQDRARPRVINRETSLGNTYDLTWTAYHDYLRAQARGAAKAALCVPLVQIATWNDYPEATTIEPTRDYGERLLVQTAAAVARSRALWNLVSTPPPSGRAELDEPVAARL
jgi:hypothetical protein